jgi:ribosomal protein L16 Arg81 hydroxylase
MLFEQSKRRAGCVPMSSAPLSLEELLAPVCTVDAFFEKHWEKEPLLVKRNKPDFYRQLFSIWDVELACYRADQGDELLIKKQGMSPEASRPYFLAYLDSYSMIINHLDRVSDDGGTNLAPCERHSKLNVLFLSIELIIQVSPTVSSFNQALARYFIHTYTVMYLTPPNSQAVPVHSDHQDVLIMQVSGKKVWQVYQPMQPLPYADEMVGKDGTVLTPEEIGTPMMKDVLLEQGESAPSAAIEPDLCNY